MGHRTRLKELTVLLPSLMANIGIFQKMQGISILVFSASFCYLQVIYCISYPRVRNCSASGLFI